MESASKKCMNTECLSLLTQSLGDSLLGRGASAGGGALLAEQKQAILGSISAVATGLREVPREADALTLSMIVALITAMEKEGEDVVRLAIAVTAGRWFSLQVSIPPTIASAIRSAIAKGKGVTTSILVALSTGCDERLEKGETMNLEPSLVAVLAPFVVEASKKPQLLQIDGVLALRLLLELDGAALLLDSKTKKNINSSSSFVYSKALTIQLLALQDGAQKPLSVAVWAAAGRLTVILFRADPAVLISSFDPAEDVLLPMEEPDAAKEPKTVVDLLGPGPIVTLLLGLLHPEKIVRAVVGSSVSEMCSRNQDIVRVLLVGMCRLLHGTGREWEKRKKAREESAKNPAQKGSEEAPGEKPQSRSQGLWVPAAPNVASALSYCVKSDPSSGCSSSRVLCPLMLCCCHPLTVGGPVRGQKLFLSLSAEGFGLSAESILEHIDEGCVLHLLLASRESHSEHMRVAGRQAVRLVCVLAESSAVAGRQVKRMIFDSLAAQLQPSELAALPSKDVDIFLDPVGALKIETKEVEPEVRVTNADRKKAGGRSARKGSTPFGGDLNDDEDWAEQVKREKAKKLLASKGGAEELAESRQKEVAAAVARVQKVINSFVHSLSLLEYLYKDCKGVATEFCSTLAPAVLSLLSSQLVGENATKCLTTMCGAADTVLSEMAA